MPKRLAGLWWVPFFNEAESLFNPRKVLRNHSHTSVTYQFRVYSVLKKSYFGFGSRLHTSTHVLRSFVFRLHFTYILSPPTSLSVSQGLWVCPEECIMNYTKNWFGFILFCMTISYAQCTGNSLKQRIWKKKNRFINRLVQSMAKSLSRSLFFHASCIHFLFFYSLCLAFSLSAKVMAIIVKSTSANFAIV